MPVPNWDEISHSPVPARKGLRRRPALTWTAGGGGGGYWLLASTPLLPLAVFCCARPGQSVNTRCLNRVQFFFLTNILQTQILIYDDHSYEHIYSISMSTFERLSWFNLEIHEVGHQERLAIDGNVISH
jgi:hypothetical protein